MAYLVQQFVKNSLLLSLTILVCWLHVTAAETVHLDYTASSVEGGSMPDQINVTVKGVLGHAFGLHLQRDKEADPNVPVSTLRKDEDGRDIKHPEELEYSLNIAYYQDPTHKAIIQATRSDKEKFQFNGELSDGGKRSNLIPQKITKREVPGGASSLTEEESYTLQPQAPFQFSDQDYIPVAHRSTPFAAVGSLKAKAVQPIFIDLAAVIDYSAYDQFYRTLATRTEALQATREHYAFIMYGVDSRYRGIDHKQYPIRVRLVDLIIAENVTTSYFTELYKREDNGKIYVNIRAALPIFQTLSDRSGKVLSHYDHSVLFTRYELNTGNLTDKTRPGLGHANGASMCIKDGRSASIIVDTGSFTQVVHISSHELGHSLGARHDGEHGNACVRSDAFVMASGRVVTTSTTHHNGWLFSKCSVNYFTAFISTLLQYKDTKKCMLEKLSSSSKVPDADQQCRNKYGSASILCMGAAFSVKSDICAAMSCRDPKTRECIPQKVIDGTVCGNGKKCLNGECVVPTGPKASIPPCKDTKSRKHCDRTLSKQPFKCFEMAERERCCTPGHC